MFCEMVGSYVPVEMSASKKNRVLNPTLLHSLKLSVVPNRENIHFAISALRSNRFGCRNARTSATQAFQLMLREFLNGAKLQKRQDKRHTSFSTFLILLYIYRCKMFFLRLSSPWCRPGSQVSAIILTSCSEYLFFTSKTRLFWNLGPRIFFRILKLLMET